jgi:hypothetical protein
MFVYIDSQIVKAGVLRKSCEKITLRSLCPGILLKFLIDTCGHVKVDY